MAYRTDSLKRTDVVGAAPAAEAESGGPRKLGLPLGLLRRRGEKPLFIPEGRGSEAAIERDTRYRRALAAADLLAVVLAGLVAVAVLGQDRLRPGALLLLPVVVAVSKVVGLYDRDPQLLRKATLDEAPALFQAATFFSLCFWLLDGLVVDGTLGRDQVVVLWLLVFVSMLVGRAIARRVTTALVAPERCIVIGDAASARRIADNLEVSLSATGEIAGRVPLLPESKRSGSIEVLGSLDALGLILVEHDVDRVLIAPGDSDSAEILDVIRLVRSLGVKVSLLPRLFEAVGSSTDWDAVNGVVLLGLRPHGLTRSSKMLKRGVDVFAAAVGLALLAPLFVWVAIAIKLDSKGTVFFRQTRIGRGGRRFEMLKFRTMIEGADAMKGSLHALNESDGLFKIANDPRITRVGRFLRKSSLDELPQLLNVLRGDMSLVGPRPLVPEDDRRVEGWDRGRLLLTPGMTGLWQILGSSRVPLHEMVKIDYLYGANWSLWGDVKILIRTLPHALCRRGI